MPWALLASVLCATGGDHVLEGSHGGGERPASLPTRSLVPCWLLKQNPDSLMTHQKEKTGRPLNSEQKR